MSDDDLWREKPSEADEPATDETQPLGGSSSSAAPPSPPPTPGSVPPAQNPYGASSPYGAPPPQNPYGAPPPQNPYAQPPGSSGGYTPPPNPYPQPGPYDQFSTPGPYGAPAAGYGYSGVLPDHPSAGLAMGLGIAGLVGLVICQLLLVLSPFAWYLGGKAVKEIDREPGRYGGRDRAQAGRIMGIIGTVFLVLAVIALIVVISLVAAAPSSPTPVSPAPHPQL
jgi:hypothetical protein